MKPILFACSIVLGLTFRPAPHAPQKAPEPVYEVSGLTTQKITFDPPKPLTIKQRIAKAWPGDDAWALRVTWCESRHDPKARNQTSSATGLFQDLRSTWQRILGQKGEARDYSVEYQTKQNWKLYSRHGPSQWVCR